MGDIIPGVPSNVPITNTSETKVDTLSKKKKNNKSRSNLLGDLFHATQNKDPLQSTIQERTATKQAIAEEGIDPSNILGKNAPVHPDQVAAWKKNPLSYDPNPKPSSANTPPSKVGMPAEAQAYLDKQAQGTTPSTSTPTSTPTSTSTSTPTSTSISTPPTVEGPYNIGEKDEDSIEEGGKSEYEVAKAVLDENNPYKSGSDLLKYLWGQGGSGKAKAIGNVLGNVLSASGNAIKGEGGNGTQWNDFVSNYMENENASRKQAITDAQEAVKVANANQAARTELIKSLEQAINSGAKLTDNDLAAINKWQTATTPTSSLDKAIASIMAKLGITLESVTEKFSGKNKK